jgi:hypothetical protein
MRSDQRFARAKGPERIIALLVAGIPNNEATPEQSAQMAFPDALCEVMKMPLAADYRGFDPGRSRVDRGVYEGSWYTTLATLYDISRSQIEQRERKRRARRRLIAVSFIAWKRTQDALQNAKVADLARNGYLSLDCPPAICPHGERCCARFQIV